MTGMTAGASDRVLFVIAEGQRRGAELECQQAVDWLRERGYDVDFAALAPASAGPPLAVDVLSPAAPAGRPRRGWAAVTVRLSAARVRLRSWGALRARSRGCALVVAYGSTTLPACAVGLLATGMPFIYRSIGDPRAWVRGPLHRARTGVFVRRAGRVVCLWDGACDAMRDLYRVAPKRLAVIPTGRDEVRFHPAEPEERVRIRTALGIGEADVVIAIVGALAEEKRIDLALRAAAAVGPVTVLVAGDGPQRDALRVEAQALAPLNVRFLGLVADVAPVFRAADVALLASRTEGLPGVVIEAALCGVATVATGVGGVRELIEHRATGYIAEAILDHADRQVEVLAEGLRITLERRREWGRNARRLAESRFGSDVVGVGWMRVLAECGVASPSTTAQV